MKICFLTGANSLHSYRWVKYFADKGYKIHWISLEPNVFEKIKNVNYYFLKKFPIKSLNILLNIGLVRKLVKQINPDIFHAHYAGVNGVLGALTGFHPFLLTAWGSDIFITAKSKLARPLIKFALRKADFITCNGETLKDEMIKLGVNPQKISFIYWATDVQKFKPQSPTHNLRKKLEIFNAPIVLNLRNLEPVYDVETLIKAIPDVLKEIPETKFLIGGEGSEKKKLRNLAENLGIAKSTKFLGWISEEEVPEYLNSVDVCVSTSLSDGDLSQGIQQAMACEVPIVTSDIQVNKNRIKDGENGLLFQKRDSKSLAQKIIILLKNKELRMRLGRKGRETIKENLNFYKEMEKAENLYKEIIKNTKYER